MENMLIINALVFIIVALLVTSGFLLYSFFKARKKEKITPLPTFYGKAPPIPETKDPDGFNLFAEEIPEDIAKGTAHGSVEIRAPRPIPPKTRPVRLQAQAADAHVFPHSGDDSDSGSLDFNIDVTEPEESGAVDKLSESFLGIVFDETEDSKKMETEVPPIELSQNTGAIPSAMIFRRRNKYEPIEEPIPEPKHELANDIVLLVKTGRYFLSFANEEFAVAHPTLYGILKTSGQTEFCHLSEKPPQYLPIKKGDITRTSSSYIARVPKAGDTFTDMAAPTAEQMKAMGIGLARSPRNPESRNS